ncbi:MAG: hypothetical protein JXA95_03605 [Spirochaetales bacterium]|nr:hypothetical protein [Spirochaetales bacterium]
MNYEKLLNKVQNSNRCYETVFYADLTGKILYSPDKDFPGTGISSREYFQAVAKKGRDTYTTTKAQVSRATGNVTIAHAAEVTRNGRTSGLLGATLNLTLLGEELLLRKKIGEMTDYLNTLLDSLSRFFSSLNGNLEALENVDGDLSANMEETVSAIHQIRVNVENSQSQNEKQEQSVRTTAAAEQMIRRII